jgi:hypothetical protein
MEAGKKVHKVWKGMDAWTEGKGEVVGRERQWIKEREDGAACCAGSFLRLYFIFVSMECCCLVLADMMLTNHKYSAISIASCTHKPTSTYLHHGF